ncbi:MAG: hotdog fold thioesterase [Bacteroidota bacterium]
MIWKNNPTVEGLNMIAKGNMVEHLGIEITEIGADFIKAKMPVDQRTKQPMGLLHGGASVALSESMGSFAGVLILDDPIKQSIVGVEINANHLKAVRSGYVYSITKAIKIGRKVQVWNTEIYNEKDEMVCTSRLTTMTVINA